MITRFQKRRTQDSQSNLQLYQKSKAHLESRRSRGILNIRPFASNINPFAQKPFSSSIKVFLPPIEQVPSCSARTATPRGYLGNVPFLQPSSSKVLAGRTVLRANLRLYRLLLLLCQEIIENIFEEAVFHFSGVLELSKRKLLD